ncbi:acyltransferase [Acetobacteraceae bacterium AT-5844]|nr:acyltransferase [Acetobacteraceae bacterium AT-5844]
MSRPSAPDGSITWSVGPSHDYVAPLDGLRALSIILVVLGHYGLGSILPGTFGVTVFFFISGFLITRQLMVEQARRGTVRLGPFMTRRLLRLWPALIVVVPIASLINVEAGGVTTFPQVAAGLFYFTNYMALFEPYNTGPSGMDSPLAPLWSIGVELHFYVLFPFLFLAIRGRLRLIAVLLVLCVVIIAWRSVLAEQCIAAGPACTAGLGAFRTAFSTDLRLDSILYGVLMSLLLNTGAAPFLLRLFNRHVTLLVALLLVLLSLTIRDPAFRSSLRYVVQGVALFLGVGCVLFGERHGWTRRLLAWRPAVLLGQWSYSLYLWHLAVLVACVPLLPEALWKPAILEMRPSLFWLLVVMPAMAALSTAVAAASYYFVERPPQRLRRFLIRQPS